MASAAVQGPGIRTPWAFFTHALHLMDSTDAKVDIQREQVDRAVIAVSTDTAEKMEQARVYTNRYAHRVIFLASVVAMYALGSRLFTAGVALGLMAKKYYHEADAQVKAGKEKAEEQSFVYRFIKKQDRPESQILSRVELGGAFVGAAGSVTYDLLAQNVVGLAFASTLVVLGGIAVGSLAADIFNEWNTAVDVKKAGEQL